MNYQRGVVDSYDVKAGCGYIRSEDPPSQQLLLVHSKSLRNRQIVLSPGERVLFRPEPIPRGTLAVDVHPEAIDDELAELDKDAGRREVGTIDRYDVKRGFGFVRLPGSLEAFFHVSHLIDPSFAPTPGATITFNLVSTDKGFQAQGIEAISEPSSAPSKSPPSSVASLSTPGAGAPLRTPPGQTDIGGAPDFLAQALAARDRGLNDQAAALYERGLRDAPSVQLILSYAAFEKWRNREKQAMEVYQKGIRLFPRQAKLREDAGILAASLGDHETALRLLNESLEICRRTGGVGEKGVILALARTSYKRGAFAETLEYYRQALELFGRGVTRLPDSDRMQMSLARIRTHHHRGDLTVDFLASSGLTIVRAEFLEPDTAEFIVELHSELSESYGLAHYLLVRSVLKAGVSRADLDQLDSSLASKRDSEICDPQVALLVVGTLQEDVRRTLWNRVEDRTALRPAVIPLQQSEIETGDGGLAVLRSVLDRWLYRRDLFAVNSPVGGQRFFGRSKTFAELRDAIATSTPTALFGLRKVGKTSILKETQRRSSETGDIVVYIDLQLLPADVTDLNWLYWKLASELYREACGRDLPVFDWRLGRFSDYLDLPTDLPRGIAFDSDLTRLLRVLAARDVTPRPKVVLLLDEIERLLPTSLGKVGFTGFFDFFSYLRGISQERENFVLIITGANTAIAEVPQFDGRDNPAFNFFRELYLPLMERSECWEMVRSLGRGMALRFPDESLSLIFRLTGGHPFFTRQFCSFIAEQNPKRPTEITATLINSAVAPYLDRRTSDFQEIVDRLRRDFPAELEICIALACAGGTLPIEDIRRQAAVDEGATLRHLAGYQIMDMDDTRAFLTIELFARWLRDRYADT